MNCECIYYSKGATMEDLERFTKAVKYTERWIERYPTAISKMDEATLCCEDYDGWGKSNTIPAGSLVAFVGGKLHHMTEIHIGKRVYRPWFPVRHDIKFTDIVTDFEENSLDESTHLN